MVKNFVRDYCAEEVLSFIYILYGIWIIVHRHALQTSDSSDSIFFLKNENWKMHIHLNKQILLGHCFHNSSYSTYMVY